MSGQNKHTVLAYVEAFNRGDIDAVFTPFTTDALVYGVLGWGGLDKVKSVWQEIMRCFNIICSWNP